MKITSDYARRFWLSIERRKRLLRETEDRPAEHTAEEAEQRSVLKAPDA